MRIIRWIISAPIAIACLLGLRIAFEWLLRVIYKVLYFITVWGTRWDAPPLFDFDAKVLDFKSFIFITCLSTLLAAGCSGFIGGLICPPKNPKLVTWLMGLIILPIVTFSVYSFWSSEHWFYSSLWIIDMILVALLFVGAAFAAQEND